MPSWGYNDEPKGTVQVAVPTAMVETVSALLADPDAFLEALRETEDALATVLVEADSGVWVKPAAIIGIEEQPGWPTCRIVLQGGYVEVDGTAEEVVQRIAAKVSEAQRRLSDPGARFSPSTEGAPPA